MSRTSIGNKAPFIPAMRNSLIPSKFWAPQLDFYDGRGNPQAHLTKYWKNKELSKTNEVSLCKCFKVTLSSPATSWYNTLSSFSILSFHEFSMAFAHQFIWSHPSAKKMAQLLNVVQKESESL